MFRYAIAGLMVLIFAGPANATDSIEYKLAVIEAGRQVAEDDTLVAHFRSLVGQLSGKFIESDIQIADMTVKGQSRLRERGVEETLLNMMEGVNQIFPSRIENQKYKEYLGSYIVLRIKGESHSSAVAGLQSLMRSLGFK